MKLITLTDSNQLVAGATLLVLGNCCDKPHIFRLKAYLRSRVQTVKPGGILSPEREPGWRVEPTVHGAGRISAPNLAKGVRSGRVQAMVVEDD